MDTIMENKRTRKFTYIYEKWDDNLITNLKLMESKYHIFGIDDNHFLKGYIFFTNPKTVLKIKKQFNSNFKIYESVFNIYTYMEIVTNNDRLDNRKCNLRIVTPEQNNRNQSSSKNSSSKYVGVSFDKRSNNFGESQTDL
jgi:hypothetical protein